MTCTTHHICDCLQAELEGLRIKASENLFSGRIEELFQENTALRALLTEVREWVNVSEIPLMNGMPRSGLLRRIDAALGVKND